MMTISTLTALRALTTDTALTDEIDAEITRLQKAQASKDAKAAEKAVAYNEAKGVVIDALRDAGAPVTAAELFEAVKDALPEGFTKGRMVYGLTRLWTGEVVKDGTSYSLR